MEESKFRVWDKEGKRFWYFTSLEVFNQSLLREKLEEVEKQKFSGFKDIKGKEIYEGDFIKEDFGEEALSLFPEDDDYDPNEPSGVVRYMDDGWVVSDGTETGGFYLEEYINSLEVAGNIYENEEWLEILYSSPEDIEIKFRVWDGKDIIYVSKGSGFRLIFEGRDWELEFKGKTHCSSTDPNCKLMQFSGAKDINGKEIYADDIVKNGLKEEEFKRKYPKEYKEDGFYIGEFMGVCKYDGSSSCWVIDDLEYQDFSMVHHLFCELDMTLVEIVGNAYKNEDLVKTLSNK